MTEIKKPGRPKGTTKQRARPVEHQGEREQKLDTLDELEMAAKQRVKSGNRISLAPKLKLEWSNQDPNFHYYWATDSEQSPVDLQTLMEAGYTFERYTSGQRRGEKVVQHSKGCKLYLMKQPKDLFELDQKEIHAKSVAQHQEIMGVGAREYAGQSKELGKGKPVELEITKESPDPISLMEGG